MDEEKLRKALVALRWEAKYRKRAKGEPAANAFLTEIETLDEDFAEAFRRSDIRAQTLLDIGTGVGWQAIQMARLGFRVTGIDASQFCLAQAARNATASGIYVEFVTDNIIHTSLTQQYDILVDRGCFTVLPEDFLADYAIQVTKLIRPDGHFLLKLDHKKESRIKYLLEKFRVVQKKQSLYLGSKGKPINAVFFLLEAACL